MRGHRRVHAVYLRCASLGESEENEQSHGITRLPPPSGKELFLRRQQLIDLGIELA